MQRDQGEEVQKPRAAPLQLLLRTESTTGASSGKRPGASVSGDHKSEGGSNLTGSQNADLPRSPAPLVMDLEVPVDSSAIPQPGSRTSGSEGNTAHSPTNNSANLTSDSDPRDDCFVPGENHNRRSCRRRRRSKTSNQTPKNKQNPSLLPPRTRLGVGEELGGQVREQ